MKNTLLACTLTIAASCATAGSHSLPASGDDTCNANNYAHFLGESKDIIDDKKGYYFQDPYNVITPGKTVDPTDRTDIIYVMLDENGIIGALSCTPPTK